MLGYVALSSRLLFLFPELKLIAPQYVVSTYPDPGYESVPQEGEAHVVYYVHTQPPAGGYGTVQPHGQFPGQQGATANAFKPKTGKKSNARSQPPIPQPSAAPSAENRAGEGSSANSDLPPPTYADAVKADNKVQH